MPRSHNESLTVTVLTPEGGVSQQMTFEAMDTVSIGRSSESDVVLKEFGKKVSRCHAVLLHDGAQWEYYSLGVNGTYENARKIESVAVETGMVLRLGKSGPILQLTLTSAPDVDDDTSDSFVLSDDGEVSGDGSGTDVSGLIQKLKQGDEAAAQQIWDRYSEQIVEIARQTMRDASRRVHDEEDVAVVAFKSLLSGIEAGRFPVLDRREHLWRLLMVITTRKAASFVERDGRQKRGGGEVRGDSAIMYSADRDESVLDGFDRLESERPSPDIAAVMADETRRLLETLPDETAQQIAVLKMEGYTHEEIATQLGINTRTVERRLKQIRDLWQGRIDAGE